MSIEKDLKLFEEDSNYYSDKKYLTNSMLGNMKDSYYWFWQYLNNGYSYPSNPNYDFGGYFHAKVLEPHKVGDRFHLSEYKTRQGGGYKKESEDTEKIVLTANEWTRADAMAANVLEDDLVGDIIANSEKEVPFIKEVFGVMCKGKLDLISDDFGTKVASDLKSTSGSIEEFMKSAWKYNYHRQAAMYIELSGADEFWFIPVEKNGSHRAGVYQFTKDSSFIQQGYDMLFEDIQTYRKLFLEGGYDPEATLVYRFEN